MIMNVLTGVGLCLLLAAVLQWLVSQFHNRRKLPPGPVPHILFGNALDIPLEQSWETFATWKQKYGDVVYLNALGKSMVVLNSHQTCIDLLEKRSAIYSDRPSLVMFSELMRWDWIVSTLRYSLRWRVYRRLFHQYFDESASRTYSPVQERNVHTFLRRTLKNPENFWKNIRLSTTETMLHLVYDIQENDSITQLLEDATKFVSEAAIPGKYIVDLFPTLRYVPGWIPGAGFQKDAAIGRSFSQNVRDVPAQVTKRNMKHGVGGFSIFASMLSECEEKNIGDPIHESSEDITRSVTGQAYAAAADTTSISICAFFLAMANHPEVQQTAQAEIDRVVGTSRLPTLNDQDDLPYIRAVVKEVLRWHSPVPLAVAHANTEDDVYQGYFIPKGSIVFPNIWAILRNPEVYKDPDAFNPSRWLIETEEGLILNKEMPDPDDAFGFGRRACPGKYFAENALFLMFSNVLASFKLSPLDENGNPVDKIDNYAQPSGFFNFIKPFRLSILPRSAEIAQVIADTEQL